MDIRKFNIFIYVIALSLLCGCYNNKHYDNNMPDTAVNDSISINDSINFYRTHHYGIGYNFIVRSDSMLLIAQQPEEHVSQLITDTFCVRHNQQIAVSDIRTIPQDSIDSLWIQVVTEEGRIGWGHESEIQRNVVPTDPISQFIMLFSDTHLIIALIIIALIVAAYIVRLAQKRNAPFVHFRDIPSFYPTALCITVACSATLYASLQMFGADTWQHFYYHPSLNPFCMPLILGIFISSVWAMLIIGIATLEDIRHYMSFDDMILYLSSLTGVCAVLYIVFSISTLYYIGYPLLCAYCWFALTRYIKHSRQNYICGKCGKHINKKGTCPYCGAVNE